MKIHLNKNYLLPLAIIAFGLFFALSNIALALSENDIVFPVEELGECASEKECKIYCDNEENMKACVNFAEKYNLMNEEEIRHARNFSEIGEGPGGCRNKEECETYCDDISHIDECIAFGEEHDIMPEKELEEAKRIQAALNQGLKMPGGCRNERQCDAYCMSPNHMEECIEFGIATGFIPQKEIKEAKQILQAVKKGFKPPSCRGKKECDIYCRRPENMRECMKFARAAGFMSEREAKEMEGVFKAIEKGIEPPPCQSDRECEEWCSASDANMKHCMDFSVAAGFMSEEEAEMAKKTGGEGPGGCIGKEACEAFCENPANEKVCFDFSMEHGMIPEEDLKRMEEGKQEVQKALTGAPPEVIECLNSLLGSETVEKLKTGTAMLNRKTGEAIDECFKKMMEQMGPPQDMPREGMRGAPQAGTKVILKQKGGSNFELIIIAPAGIKEFSFQPTTGSRYSGGLSGCPKEYKTITIFDQSGFPLEAFIIDCQDNKEEFKISSEGEFMVGGGQDGPGMMAPEEMMMKMPEGMTGPGGCQTPEECEKYCREHPQECMDFKVPEGMMAPEERPGMLEKLKGFKDKFFEIQVGKMRPGMMPPEIQVNVLEKMTPEMIECLRSTLGNEFVEKMKSGESSLTPDFEEKIRPCIEMYKKMDTELIQPKEIRIPSPDEIQRMMGDSMRDNPCDFNRDGTVDEHEKEKCMSGELPPPPGDIQMPNMPPTEMPSLDYIKHDNPCDFNRDGQVDAHEKEKCMSGEAPPPDGNYIEPVFNMPPPESNYIEPIFDISPPKITEPPPEPTSLLDNLLIGLIANLLYR